MQRRQVGDVAVLAVDALDHDQHPAVLVAGGGEDRVEGRRVVVRERPPGRPGQLAALDDAVVGERVVDDEVARADEVPDHGDVRRVPADQRDRVVGAEQRGQLGLQLLVDRLLPGQHPARGAELP